MNIALRILVYLRAFAHAINLTGMGNFRSPFRDNHVVGVSKVRVQPGTG